MPPLILPPHFRLRAGTQDATVFHEVYHEDEYRVPRMAPEDVVIDGGANIGAFVRLAWDRGSRAVHCWEPHPGNFAILSANVGRLPGVWLHRAALAGRAGDVRLHDGGPRFSAAYFLSEHGGLPVRAVSLDDVLAPFPAVRFLKLDIERAEWDVLPACRLLSRCREVAVEVHNIPGADALDGASRLGYVLEAAGLEIEYGPHPRVPGLAWLRGVREG